MNFRGIFGSRLGGGLLDQAGHFCYDECNRYKWIYALYVALVSKPRLARISRFLVLFPAYTVSIEKIPVHH